MLSKIFSAAVIGLEAQIIEVEVDVSYGLRYFEIVGLPDKSVEEAKERVNTAIKSTNLSPPYHQPIRVLANLAPADLKKEGTLYDLPLAIGFLLASKQIKPIGLENKVLVGELALNGELRVIRGVLSIAIKAKEEGFSEIILPKPNAAEAAFALMGESQTDGGFRVVGAANLKEVIDYLEGRIQIVPFLLRPEDLFDHLDYSFDIGYIKGQEYAKRALEIAASGGHHLLMEGPPGTGKTLLARAVPSLLPRLTPEEGLEVTKIYSVAGLLPKEKPFITISPFRAPHHTASEVALIGGGNPPRPGEITLAHRGVLFLDEFPEFHRDVLESLRQPIEEGRITILRAKNSLTMPARFTLVAATNPCPCGHYGNPEIRCVCSSSQIQMYRRKLSGPLMDRVDLFVNVPPLKYERLSSNDDSPRSKEVRERVEKARRIQRERFSQEKVSLNSEMEVPQIKKYCQTDSKSQTLLKKYVDSGRLSARGYHRVLKVARTIADLENSGEILHDHIGEAIMYRLREEARP